MEANQVLPALLTNEQAAAYIDVTPETLAVWRSTRRYDIPFLKIGSKVRYRRTDLDGWLDSRRVCRPADSMPVAA